MCKTSASERVLAGLLCECIRALETLLASPDLNLDKLEPATRGCDSDSTRNVRAAKEALAERQ